jgi:hypothetical protein
VVAESGVPSDHGGVNSRELERLNKQHLVPRLPGYAAKGTLVFASPVGDLLRALDFEPSGFQRDTRRLRCFVMPLYEPETWIRYTFGRVLGGANEGQGDWWFDFPEDRGAVMEQIADLAVRDALPWLDRVRTPGDLVERAHEIRPDLDSHVQMAVSLSHILCGNHAEAQAGLRQMRQEILEGDDDREWVRELADLGAEIADEIDADPQIAVNRLRRWRDAAVRELGLAKFADPPVEEPAE